MQIHSRRRLLAITITVQVAAIIVGGVSLYNMTRDQIGENIREIIYEQNDHIGHTVTKLIAESHMLENGSLEFGSPSWELVQGIVEDTTLPAGAFVCLLDADGRILCHPKLRINPALRHLPIADRLLRTDGGDYNLRNIARNRDTRGELEVSLGVHHYITARPLAGTDALLIVHQPVSGLHSFSESFTSGSMWIAVGILVVIVATTLVNAAVIRRFEIRLEEINRDLEHEVERRTRDSVARLHCLIFGLASLADHRDSETGAHLERICSYACLLAEALRDDFAEIDDDWISCLRLAASLHDIGKVGVPDAILLKPGKLTDEEWVEIRKHPAIGAQTLKVIRDQLGEDPLIEMAIDVAQSHHERWDGAGYPDGLAETDIPLSARLVAVADVYDALTSKRVYKDAMAHEKTCTIIVDGAATQFDPQIIKAFKRVQPVFRSIHKGLQERSLKIGGRSSAQRAA